MPCTLSSLLFTKVPSSVTQLFSDPHESLGSVHQSFQCAQGAWPRIQVWAKRIRSTPAQKSRAARRKFKQCIRKRSKGNKEKFLCRFASPTSVLIHEIRCTGNSFPLRHPMKLHIFLEVQITMQENMLIADALDFVTDSPKETPRTIVAIHKFSSAKINLTHKNIKV